MITLKFQKSNPAFISYHERNDDYDEDEENEEEENEEEDDEPEYFLVNLCIGYMNSVCWLNTEEY